MPHTLFYFSSWSRRSGRDQWRGDPAHHHHHPCRWTHWGVQNDGKGVTGVVSHLPQSCVLDHLSTQTWPPFFFNNVLLMCTVSGDPNTLSTLSLSLSKCPWSDVETYFVFQYSFYLALTDFLLQLCSEMCLRFIISSHFHNKFPFQEQKAVWNAAYLGHLFPDSMHGLWPFPCWKL